MKSILTYLSDKFYLDTKIDPEKYNNREKQVF